MPLTHIDLADFMKLLGVAVKKFSPYNVNFPVRWANNPKYSQKLLMHIYVCVCLLIYCDVHICICVFEYLYFSKSASTWMHPPWVSIAQSQPSSQERLFFPLLGAHFSTQDSSRKWMRIAAKVQKCTNTQTQIQKYTDANIQIHKMQIHFSADKWMRIATKAQRCTTVALCSLSGELSCRQRPFVILCGAKSQKNLSEICVYVGWWYAPDILCSRWTLETEEFYWRAFHFQWHSASSTKTV